MTIPLVGVLGASGAVGRAAAESLRGHVRLRLGARRGVPYPAEEVVSADAFGNLSGFCTGCSVVLNCAGPSYRIGDRVAVAALAAGAHYVDVSGDDPVHAALKGRRERAMVLSAGLQPGISGLLPRWAVSRSTAVTGLSVYAGGLDRITPAAAADYLVSLDGDHGSPLAAWRNGRRAERALQLITSADLEFFPGRVTAHPYLSTEAERLAGALGLIELDWYTVLAGEQVRLTLNRLRGRTWTSANEAEFALAVERLTRASAVDLAGRRTCYSIVINTAGAERKTVVLRAADSYRVTGVTGALAVLAVLEGRVGPGTHFAADVLDPGDVVAGIRRSGAASVEEYEDGAAEEGVL